MTIHELSSSPREDALPLHGIRVLEFSHTVMGPACGLVLADLGADVIKVEPSPAGDRTRLLEGFAAGFFSCFNRNKRSIALDLKSREGLATAKELVKISDVIIENFAPGAMDRLGLGWEAVNAINPCAIYCSLKGFLPGPYENRLALDEVVQYMAGLAYMTGPPGQPMRAGSSIVDILGGTFGVIAILTALRDREKTGEGQIVRSSLFESAAYLSSQHMAGEGATGRSIPPMPARISAWAIYETFQASDGERIFLGITTDGIWKRFCAAFGRADLLDDPALATNELRVAARDRLQPMVSDIVSNRSSAELEDICYREAIPFSRVVKPGDLFDDAQLNSNGRMMDVRLSDGKTVKLPGLPMEIGDYQFDLRLQPPGIGEHTEELLAEIAAARGEDRPLVRAGGKSEEPVG